MSKRVKMAISLIFLLLEQVFTNIWWGNLVFHNSPHPPTTDALIFIPYLALFTVLTVHLGFIHCPREGQVVQHRRSSSLPAIPPPHSILRIGTHNWNIERSVPIFQVYCSRSKQSKIVQTMLTSKFYHMASEQSLPREEATRTILTRLVVYRHLFQE